jgi:hypothetical protein
MTGNARCRPFKLIHSLRFAVSPLCQCNMGAQSNSKVHLRSYNQGSSVAAQGAAYSRNGLCRQGYESGI